MSNGKSPVNDDEKGPQGKIAPFWVESNPHRPAQSHRSASSGNSFFGRIGLAQPSLRISTIEDVFFVHPAAEGVPTDSERLRGHVSLWLPKARSIKDLSVRFFARYDIAWPDTTPYESGVCLERTVSLVNDGEEMQLDKGEHTFEFIVHIPPSTPPYERSIYGRVRAGCQAVARSLGPLGSDLLTPERRIYICVNPGLEEQSRPPPPLNLRMVGETDEFGPYAFKFQSQYAMVGGLVLLKMHFLAPNTELVVHAVRVKVLQTSELQSPATGHSCTTKPFVQPVFTLDALHPPNNASLAPAPSSAPLSPSLASPSTSSPPLFTLTPGTEYRLRHLGRLPNDNGVRPTTQEGTDTPIRMRHDMQIEVVWSRGGEEGERKKTILTQRLNIFSCACFFDSLTLPLYSPTDPNPMTDNTRILIPCVCGMPFRRLVEEHGSSLVRRHASRTAEEGAAVSEESDSDEDDETRARNRRRRAEEGRPKVGELR
ncbi:Proteophosphoglycan ppg4 [Rhodotorula toruloides ATCC 204091]|uniref:Proteophosphoglycan ppg4 n=1 Tax=Rhodotorula toruloides TaxID=5286 RepID=A0A0K3C826_RHOTO|nr:Proteophosphoglycan ppg4 [Rhodotorula toruloides ATCC 204091]KAK4331488.1 Proteophosphoglycan ppg4 [Rhodotorula toruloides]PRQ77877.1 Proteophosphoglycan ppg4 [Rhodotorula toruloides]